MTLSPGMRVWLVLNDLKITVGQFLTSAEAHAFKKGHRGWSIMRIRA